MFEKFIKKLEDDVTLPANLVGEIKNLFLTDKLAASDTLKKMLEELTYMEIASHENNPN